MIKLRKFLTEWIAGEQIKAVDLNDTLDSLIFTNAFKEVKAISDWNYSYNFTNTAKIDGVLKFIALSNSKLTTITDDGFTEGPTLTLPSLVYDPALFTTDGSDAFVIATDNNNSRQLVVYTVNKSTGATSNPTNLVSPGTYQKQSLKAAYVGGNIYLFYYENGSWKIAILTFNKGANTITLVKTLNADVPWFTIKKLTNSDYILVNAANYGGWKLVYIGGADGSTTTSQPATGTIANQNSQLAGYNMRFDGNVFKYFFRINSTLNLSYQTPVSVDVSDSLGSI